MLPRFLTMPLPSKTRRHCYNLYIIVLTILDGGHIAATISLKTHATFYIFQQLVFGGEKVKVKYNNFDEELMQPHHQQPQQNDQNFPP